MFKIPGWALDAYAEEMSSRQAVNMIGQHLDKEKKADLVRRGVRDAFAETIRGIVNALGLQAADEKPTLAWLVRRVSAGEIAVERLDEDADVIVADLAAYYKRRKEIGKLDSLTYRALKTAVDKFERGEEMGRSDVFDSPVASADGVELYEFKSPKKAARAAEGTRWCTQNEDTAAEYIRSGLLYVVLDGGKRVAQLHIPRGQAKDVEDDTINGELAARIRSTVGGYLSNIIRAHYADKKNDWRQMQKISAMFMLMPDQTPEEKLLAFKAIDFAEDTLAADTLAAEYTDDEISGFLKESANSRELHAPFECSFSDGSFVAECGIEVLANYVNAGDYNSRENDTWREYVSKLLEDGFFIIYDFPRYDANIFSHVGHAAKEKMLAILKKTGEIGKEAEVDDVKAALDEDGEYAGEIVKAIRGAYLNGEEVGTYDDFFESYVRAVSRAGFDVENGECRYTLKEPGAIAAHKVVTSGFDSLFDANEDYHEEEPYIDIRFDEPDYGWSGFSQAAFDESLAEQLAEILNNAVSADKREGQLDLFGESRLGTRQYNKGAKARDNRRFQMKRSDVIPEWAAKKFSAVTESEDPTSVPAPGLDNPGDDDFNAEAPIEIENALQLVVSASKADLEMVLEFIKDREQEGEEPYSNQEFGKKARSVVKYLLGKNVG